MQVCVAASVRRQCWLGRGLSSALPSVVLLSRRAVPRLLVCFFPFLLLLADTPRSRCVVAATRPITCPFAVSPSRWALDVQSVARDRSRRVYRNVAWHIPEVNRAERAVAAALLKHRGFVLQAMEAYSAWVVATRSLRRAHQEAAVVRRRCLLTQCL